MLRTHLKRYQRTLPELPAHLPPDPGDRYLLPHEAVCGRSRQTAVLEDAHWIRWASARLVGLVKQLNALDIDDGMGEYAGTQGAEAEDSRNIVDVWTTEVLWCRDAEGRRFPVDLTCNPDPASVHSLPLTSQAVSR